MSNPRDRRNKTVLEEALGLEPERVIERPRNDVVEVSGWVKPLNPARKLTPEKSYYDLQDVLNWFASNNGFDIGSIEGDKVVIYKERKK